MLHLGSAYFLNVGWGMHGRTGVSGLRMLESNVGWGCTAGQECPGYACYEAAKKAKDWAIPAWRDSGWIITLAFNQ
jgi:hypothetical protein